MKLVSIDKLKSYIQTLPEFELKPISIDGNITKKFKAVCFKNSSNPVAVVSSKYKLVQHKTIFSIVLEKLEENITNEKIYGWIEHNKTKAYMFLTFFDVEIPYDSNYRNGIMVTNSVNTELSVWINLFTFREICKNGLIKKIPLLEIQNKHIGIENFYNRFKQRLQHIIDIFEDVVKTELEYYEQIKNLVANSNEILSKLNLSRKALVKIRLKLKDTDTLFNIYQSVTNYFSSNEKLSIDTRVTYIKKIREVIDTYVKNLEKSD